LINRYFLLIVLQVACAIAPRGVAQAHSPTNAVYSKYEATTSGSSVVFVFALDKNAILQLIERDVTHYSVEAKTLESHRAFFSQWLFARFFVSNNGVACSHPAELARFFFDDTTSRVLAVTRFVCSGELSELTIRSLISHDTPTSHELVGDLKYHRALERSFFVGDQVEAHISLPSLPQSSEPSKATGPRQHGKFSYAAVPDRERRYESLAAAELGSDFVPENAIDVHPWTSLFHFIGQGIFHIFSGYDHVLFILTLMLSVASWRRLALIVTSFTAAHSLTLILATLGLVTLPARVVEPLIALSVLVVALDAVLRPHGSARAAVTFCFGLVHGFGLSNVLRDLGLHGRELAPALLGFNVGVEIGQLAIVAPLFPLVLLLRRKPDAYAQARRLLCSSVAVIAVFWIVARVGAAIKG
jgi:hydrogenase/urease accessory protein HupE